MKTLALDPAASCGWAVADVEASGPVGDIAWGTWNLTPNQGRKAGKTEHPGERLSRLREHLGDAYREHRFERIVYEEASYGSINGATSARHSEKAGIILYFASLLQIPADPIHPTKLKKALTGAGNAKKADCIRAVQLRTNIDVGKEHDAADAIGLLFVEGEAAG